MMASQPSIDTDFFFFEGNGGLLFSALYTPVSGISDSRPIIFVQPFGDELNKSRRMISMQARGFARNGISTLMVDLPGCGDSHGDLASVTWEMWLDELEKCLGWLSDRAGRPVCIWGLRMGALLAVELARRCRQSVDGMLLWQPIHEGRTFINGLLRQSLARSIVQPGESAEPTPDLRGMLSDGKNVEVGGYTLTPEMVEAIGSSSLRHFDCTDMPVFWFDVSSRPVEKLSPASVRAIRQLEARSVDVEACVVRGNSFWGTVEITECPALLEATTSRFS